MTKLVVIAVFSAAVLALTGGPAAAQSGGPDRGDGGVSPTDDGLLGRVQQQVDQVNEYEGRSVPCTWTMDGDAGPEAEYVGTWRIRLLREVGEDDPSPWAEGLQWVRECWPNDPALQMYDTNEEDGWSPNWQAVWITDAITPENLARLAMEEFFLGLPAPEPHFSPESPTMVNLATWMWVEGVPAGAAPPSEIESPVISVPGISVQAFAQVVSLDWDMGNGDTKSCPGLPTSSAEAQTTCTYTYERSSAGQDGSAYHGSVMLMWQGTYSVNDVIQDEVFDIARETPFDLGVEEAQAINTGG